MWSHSKRPVLEHPVLDETTFQQILAAAHVLQETNERRRKNNAQMANVPAYEWQRAFAAERDTMLKALERIRPQLHRLASEPQKSSRRL
jgi:hypothetical protein